jgi:hypothetical protein
MITGVNFRPKFYAPAYNPIVWSVSSSKAALTTIVDFKYVFDIYIDDVKVNRIKQRPNPVGVGMIDVSLIAQSYLDIGNFANEVGTVTAKPMKTGIDAVCSVYMLIGEEYATDADPNNLVLYPGTSDSPGSPSYRVGAQGFSTSGGSTAGNELVPVICLPYTLEWSEQQETLAIQNTLTPPDYYGLFGYVAPYVLKNPSLYPASTCNSLGLFLSKSPRTTAANGNWETSATAPAQNFTSYDLPYDRQTLTFLNRNPVYQYFTTSGTFPYLQASSPIVAWYEFYNSAGTNIGEYSVSNSQTFGGSPRELCNSQISTFSNTDNQELISLRVGPKDLEDLNVWVSLGQVPAYYTVQLFANLTINSECVYTGAPSVPLSELVTIQITEDCTSYLYPRVRLVWLNSLGGRDYWNFTMFAEETLDAKGLEYYQPEVLWSNTTPVITSGDKTQNWLHGGNRSYNKTSTTKWTIMTDWLTQDEVNFLKETVQSPQVWAYIGEQDFPYTGKIVETSYTVKTVKMVKMFKITFNLETSTERSMQNV